MSLVVDENFFIKSGIYRTPDTTGNYFIAKLIFMKFVSGEKFRAGNFRVRKFELCVRFKRRVFYIFEFEAQTNTQLRIVISRGLMSCEY